MAQARRLFARRGVAEPARARTGCGGTSCRAGTRHRCYRGGAGAGTATAGGTLATGGVTAGGLVTAAGNGCSGAVTGVDGERPWRRGSRDGRHRRRLVTAGGNTTGARRCAPAVLIVVTAGGATPAAPVPWPAAFAAVIAGGDVATGDAGVVDAFDADTDGGGVLVGAGITGDATGGATGGFATATAGASRRALARRLAGGDALPAARLPAASVATGSGAVDCHHWLC